MKQDQRTEAADLGWLCPESRAPKTPTFPACLLWHRLEPIQPYATVQLDCWPFPKHRPPPASATSLMLTLLPQAMRPQFTPYMYFSVWFVVLPHKAPCTVSGLHPVLHALNLCHTLTPSSLAVKLASSGPTILPAFLRQMLSRSFVSVPQHPEQSCALSGPQPVLIKLHWPREKFSIVEPTTWVFWLSAN